jgi:cytidylate kinase
MAELIITIDGPAGSGKSTAAKLLAAKIGAAFLDTGAMYRAVTLVAMQNQIDLNDVKALEKLIDAVNFKFEIAKNQMTVKINNQDATEQIRDPKVTANVHFIASQPSLRDRLVKMQRDFADRHEKIVTEGRDQGTVVFPDANFKFFLIANPKERAKRRGAELTQKGHKVDLARLQNDIEKRDASDKNRDTAPLVAAKDAVIIDNTNFTQQQTLNEILKTINKKD